MEVGKGAPVGSAFLARVNAQRLLNGELALPATPAGNTWLDVDWSEVGTPVGGAVTLAQLAQVDLIDNSLHYGGEKMTTIRVTVSGGSEPLRIMYDDDGAGVSADDKKQLFTKGFGKHTGLGLFLSREILSITGISITETGEPAPMVKSIVPARPMAVVLEAKVLLRVRCSDARRLTATV